MAQELLLSVEQINQLLFILRDRFDRYPERHAGMDWVSVQKRLENNTIKLRALFEMERTGGEPDVTGYDPLAGEYIFMDCSAESPAGRRSLCYDKEAWLRRKDNRPLSNAVEMANYMGIELLTEKEYHHLQALGDFDTKTSSWILTPPEIRWKGGALFGDKRYGRVFIYHNGAESYFAARGFRGVLRV